MAWRRWRLLLLAFSGGAAFEAAHAARPLGLPFDDDGARVELHSRTAVLVVVFAAAQDQVGPVWRAQQRVASVAQC